MFEFPKYEGTEPQWYVDSAGQWYRIGEPDPRPMIVKLYEQRLKELQANPTSTAQTPPQSIPPEDAGQ